MGAMPKNEPQQEIAGPELGFDAHVPEGGYRWWYLMHSAMTAKQL